MASINTNLSSLMTQQHRGRAQSSLSTAMERLSSGLRVNSAKDDAAGQAIGNRMTAQVTGQAQAMRNANDGVSLSQTAGGALGSVNDKLQRVRELTVQSLNSTLNQSDLDAIQAEINLNLKEIDRLNEQTSYNGMRLLDGSAGEVMLQVGANDGETLGVDLRPPGFSTEALGLKDFTVSGVYGEVEDINSLPGNSVNIVLSSAATEVEYLDTDGEPMPEGTRLMLRQGTGEDMYYYVRSEDELDPSRTVHYKAAYEAHSTTATRSSDVDVTVDKSIYYRETDTVDGYSSMSFYKEGAYLDDSQLVQGNDTDNSKFYIENSEYNAVVGEDETFYYSADLTVTGYGKNSGSVRVEAENPLRLSTQTYDESLAQVGGTALDNVTYVNDYGPGFDASTTDLVEIDDRHYIRVEDGEDFIYYSTKVSNDLNEGNRLTAETEDGRAVTTREFSSLAYDEQEFSNINESQYDSLALVEDATTGEQFVEATRDGESFYFSASVTLEDRQEVTGADADGNDIITTTTVAEVTVLDFTKRYKEALGNSTELEVTPTLALADTPIYRTGEEGSQLDATLVQGEDDGRYYLRWENADDTTKPVTYEPVEVAAHITADGEQSLLVDNIGPERAQADFDSAVLRTSTPDFNVAGSGVDVEYNIDDSQLTYNQSGSYYLRTSESTNSAEFYRARTTTVIEHGSSAKININGYYPDNASLELDDVITVTGTSTVSLEPLSPPNVVVRYQEASGAMYGDVLRKDDDGNYIMRISEEASSDYKTATLVELKELEGHYLSEDAQYLIKSVNGNGEIVIYHAMDYTAETNAGSDRTVVVLSETGEEIRLRQPRDPLAALDRAIARVDEKRSTLGATENRLGSAIDTLATTSVNLTAARSRILDADYAVEVANMSKAQILMQAGDAVLAQANQVPQNVLSLLQ